MNKRKHAIRRDAGQHLTDRQREILGRDWNRYVNRLAPVSLREFARIRLYINAAVRCGVMSGGTEASNVIRSFRTGCQSASRQA